MDQKFQELKCQYEKVKLKHIAPIFEKMKKNLLNRNEQNDIYQFHHAKQEKTYKISTCNVGKLISIDKDLQTPNDSEFKNLIAEYEKNKKQYLDPIVKEMKKNLVSRNGNNDEYTFVYTQKGLTVKISTIEEDGEPSLFAIDGDLNSNA